MPQSQGMPQFNQSLRRKPIEYLLRQFVPIGVGDFPQQGIGTMFHLLDEATTFFADGCHQRLTAVKQFFHGRYKTCRQVLHLADFVNQIQIDIRIRRQCGGGFR